MSQIKKAREELLRIADWLDDDMVTPTDAAAKIRSTVAARMYRCGRGKRVDNKSTTMTAEIRDSIKLMDAEHPHMSQQQIAHHFNINPGRVSEAVHGKWDHL